jgi:flagellar motor switch protein FliN/FliY
MPDKISTVRLVNDGETDSQSERIDHSVIASVEVHLEARLGSASMSVSKLMQLKVGDSVPLDAALNSDVELRLNGIAIARGELVTVGGNFGVRLLDIVK